MPRHRPTLRLLPAILATAALAACSAPALTEFAPSCPRVAVLADAADLSRYRPGGGQDLTDLIADGRIAGFQGDCQREDKEHVRASLSVDLAVQRGPAAPSRRIDVSYFVAVREGERILDKQIYPLRVDFPENRDTVRVTGPEASLLVAVSKEKSAAAYDVLIGFQLTPEELALNRRRGQR